MKRIDKAFLSEISSLANIIPIISQADCMTIQERKAYLLLVQSEIDGMSRFLSREIIFDFREDNISFVSDNSCQVNNEIPMVPSDELLDTDSAGLKPTGTEVFEIDYSHAFLPLQVNSNNNNNNMNMSYSAVLVQRDEEESDELHINNHPMEHSFEAVQSPAAVREDYLLPMVPNIFAVICSSISGPEEEQMMRRDYPWGSILIEDESSSDFRRLQRLMFESDKISELREKTQEMTIHIATCRSPASVDRLRFVTMTISLLLLLVTIVWSCVLSGPTTVVQE